MSTQITGAQNNFVNQAAEFGANDTSKGKPSTEQALAKVTHDKVTHEANVEDVRVNQFREQQATSKSTVSNEEALHDENKPLAIEHALELIADFMQLSSRNVNFQQDEASDKTVIKFFDTESKELIKQFPSEEVLEIAQKIVALRQDVGEKTGIFLEEKA